MTPAITLPMIIMMVIMVIMIALFIWDKLRSDVIAIMVLVILGLTHLLPIDKLFSGFSSNAVVSIMAVMMIGAGLEKTGVVGKISKFSLKLSQGKPNKLFWILSLASGLMAGLLRSTGGFALLMPAITRIAIFLHIPRSRLLMPLGFCAIIGGTLTIIGSGPLILLNGIMKGINGEYDGSHNLVHIKPLSMFGTFPVGFAVLVAVIIFFVFIGKRFLRDTSKDKFKFGADSHEFRRTYGFGGRFYEVKIAHDSPIKGLNLSELENLLVNKKIAVVAIAKNGEILIPPLRRTQLSSSSRIALLGKLEAITEFADSYKLRVRDRLRVFSDLLNPMRSGFSEIVIPPNSDLIGKSMSELHMRRNHGVQVLAVFRGNYVRQGSEMKSLNIRSGDTLGLFSEWKYLAKLERRREFAVVTTDFPREAYNPKKRWHALTCLAISLILVLFCRVPAGVGLLTGALGMLLTGVIDIDDAYFAVSWKTIFLLAGLIPFGLAMQSSGAANWIAMELLHFFGNLPPWIVLSLLAIIAALFSLVMSNVGATVVLVPIAMHIAISIHADPRLFAIVTALATSNSFIVPTHQVSSLLAGPGGYKTTDFLKIGSMVSIIYLVVMLLASYAWFGLL